jgi:hypothetical protein
MVEDGRLVLDEKVVELQIELRDVDRDAIQIWPNFGNDSHCYLLSEACRNCPLTQ